MSLSEEAKQAIKEEEDCTKTTIDSLTYQLNHSSRKLRSESKRARELTSAIVASTRDEDKALLASDEAVAHAMSHRKASDIEVLQKQIEKPYFARFVLDESKGTLEGRKLEYKLGFSANSDCRIVDWRTAPISRLYYEYQEGDEYSEVIQGMERSGTVLLRNAVDINNQQLEKLSCRHGNFVFENEEWKRVEGGLRSRSSGGSYGTLPDVLSLITRDQFKTITEDADTAILIQGIAGSGKTTVALHRLAWLLHEDNSELKPQKCVVIVLSKILKSYVENALPAIGVEGTKVLTFSEWTNRTIAEIAPHLAGDDQRVQRPAQRAPKGIERLKRSLAMLKCLENREKKSKRALLAELDSQLPWDNLPSGLRKILQQALDPGPAAGALDDIQAAVARGLAHIAPNNPLYQGLSQAQRVIAQKLESENSLEDAVIAVLSEPDLLIAADESSLIDRELIQQARQRAVDNKQEQVLDYCDDALFLRLTQLRRGNLVLPDGTSGKYDHIVVDEVQDFSPVELAVFIAAVKRNRDLTLVGDTAQKIDLGSDFPGWKKLMQHWDFKDSMSKYLSLTVSHRSTLPIMKLAEYVQGRTTVTEGRKGRVPIWFKCQLESKGIKSVVQWLGKALEKYPTALTAVITPSLQEAKYALSLLEPSFGAVIRLGDEHCFSFEEGIIVTDVRHVKGLEFLNVLLWNPTAKLYPPNPHSRNLLYTAMTRTEENLCIVTWKKPTPLLPPLYSKLVRGINMSEEEV